MTRILLTNDDGIHSEGLQILEGALREVGDVFVVAPAAEMSGASHSLTLSRPLRIRRIDDRFGGRQDVVADDRAVGCEAVADIAQRSDIREDRARG